MILCVVLNGGSDNAVICEVIVDLEIIIDVDAVMRG